MTPTKAYNVMLPQHRSTPLAIQLINLCACTRPDDSVEALIQALALATSQGGFNPREVIDSYLDATKPVADLSDAEVCDCGDCTCERGAN